MARPTQENTLKQWPRRDWQFFAAGAISKGIEIMVIQSSSPQQSAYVERYIWLNDSIGDVQFVQPNGFGSTLTANAIMTR